MAKNAQIKLNDILLNTENYRFEPASSQREAIEKMLENQGDKLYKLAEHIVDHGLNPNDKIMLTPSHENKKNYIVLEGNRRITSLKLLLNPELIEDEKYTNLKRKFRLLKEESKFTHSDTVECIVYSTPEEADIWIKLKHSGALDGIGTAEWNPSQKQRFEETVEGKSSTVLQMLDFVKMYSQDEELKKSLEKVKVSNIGRLLSDPDVRKHLGLELNNGLLQSNLLPEEVAKGLVTILNLSLKGLKVDDIYTKKDRQEFIEKIDKGLLPNKQFKSLTNWPLNNPTVAVIESDYTAYDSTPTTTNVVVDSTSENNVTASNLINSKKRENQPSIKRKSLIPDRFKIQITNSKVNDLYHELKKIDVIKYPIAVSTAFRVFVELSLDCYLEENTMVATITASASSFSLEKKILDVASHLENTKKADKNICKGIRVAVKDKNNLIGIETLHAYIHNNNFTQTPENLIISWNNIQDFLAILWENI